MQQRYYQPIGRFPSPDPLGPEAGNIYSFNRYAYASNNPIINIDPDGRKSTDDPCMGNMQCVSSGGDTGGGGSVDGDNSKQEQNLDDEITANVNQLNVGNDAHDVLQAYALAFSQNFFAERWRDPNGVFFGGRPDIGNVFTKELWEIKSAAGLLSASPQLNRYVIFSGFKYKAGSLPSFFGGSRTLSLPGIYATYNYQFEGGGVITYTYTLKSQYRYQAAGRRPSLVAAPTTIFEILESIANNPVMAIP